MVMWKRTGMKGTTRVASIRRRLLPRRTIRKRAALWCAFGAVAFAAAPIAAEGSLSQHAISARAVDITSSGARFTFGDVLSGTLSLSAAQCSLAAPDGLVASFQFRGDLRGLSSYRAPGGAHFSGPQVFDVLINDPSRNGGTWTRPFSQTSGTGWASVLGVQLVGAYAWLATSREIHQQKAHQPEASAASEFHPTRTP